MWRDRCRSRCHFLPPANWINDPNGPIYDNGYYHLFYQLNPYGDQWGHIGPNDQLIGLTHLIAQHAVSPGEHIALLGMGIGMTWTSTILQVEHVPPAMHAHAPPLHWPWRAPIPASTGEDAS